MSEDTGGKDPSSFEERLRAARSRRGIGTEPASPGPKSGKDEPSPWSIGLRVGIELVAAMVVAVAIGYGLDWVLGTKPIFMAVFVLLGGAAGVLNVWRMFAPDRSDPWKSGKDGGK
jgi:ATP synthase protein I